MVTQLSTWSLSTSTRLIGAMNREKLDNDDVRRLMVCGENARPAMYVQNRAMSCILSAAMPGIFPPE